MGASLRGLSRLAQAFQADRGVRLPVVASRDEVKAVLERMRGAEELIARLLYGTAMRMNEALRLRVQDLQFDQNRIVVRAGKGDRDRYVGLPAAVKQAGLTIRSTSHCLRHFCATHLLESGQGI